MNVMDMNKTVVDIVAAMRQLVGPDDTMHNPHEIMRRLADKIEEAHKREVEKLNSVIQATVSRSDAEIDRLQREVAELRKQIGNVAKMREALIRCATLGEYCFQDIHAEVAEVSRAALAAPARNCDTGTAEEQGARLRRFCLRQKWCDRCPLRQRSMTTQADCKLLWAQLPYDESEAK